MPGLLFYGRTQLTQSDLQRLAPGGHAAIISNTERSSRRRLALFSGRSRILLARVCPAADGPSRREEGSRTPAVWCSQEAYCRTCHTVRDFLPQEHPLETYLHWASKRTD